MKCPHCGKILPTTQKVVKIPQCIVDYCNQGLSWYKPFDNPQLLWFSDLPEQKTCCWSNDPNKNHFTPEIIAFLKGKIVEPIIAEIGMVDTDDGMRIGNLAILWKTKDKKKFSSWTNKFSLMISKAGGSLRAEDCPEDDPQGLWDCYESE